MLKDKNINPENPEIQDTEGVEEEKQEMTINEAIEHIDQVIEETPTNDCKLEHIQLKQWLQELQDLKENKEEEVEDKKEDIEDTEEDIEEDTDSVFDEEDNIEKAKQAKEKIEDLESEDEEETEDTEDIEGEIDYKALFEQEKQKTKMLTQKISFKNQLSKNGLDNFSDLADKHFEVFNFKDEEQIADFIEMLQTATQQEAKINNSKLLLGTTPQTSEKVEKGSLRDILEDLI